MSSVLSITGKFYSLLFFNLSSLSIYLDIHEYDMLETSFFFSSYNSQTHTDT